MTGCGEVAQDLECAGGIALDIRGGHKENHDCIRRFIRGGRGGAAHNTLQICTLEIPASAVGGPDLL